MNLGSYNILNCFCSTINSLAKFYIQMPLQQAPLVQHCLYNKLEFGVLTSYALC